MFKNILSVLVCLVVTACVPSPAQSTSTANAAIAQTETAAPSPTYTPSPTLTSTPISTPIGGGYGELLFSVSSLSHEGIISETGGIYKINSDGTDLEQILNPAQIESIIGDKYDWVIYGVDHEQNYIIAKKGFYVVTDDWRLISKVDLSYSEHISYYSDFKHIYWKDADGNLYITNGETGTQLRFDPNDSVIGNSVDGTTIYFTSDFGRQMWSVNSDGSYKHRLELDALKEFNNDSYPRRLDTMATSLGNQQVAFTWADLLFVADATDLEFSSPRFISKLPEKAYTLVWSPDGEYLMIELYPCVNNDCYPGDTMLINISTGKIELVISVKEFGSVELCGFSPNSNQMIFRLYDRYMIRSVERGDQSPIDIQVPGYYPIACPVWR